jgi:hypothetical protein
MSPQSSDAKNSEKPTRLYAKSYVRMIKNSLGSRMFQNFYVETEDQGQFDALESGLLSCAFFVSSILLIFKKIRGVHATVASTVQDLKESGWKEVNKPQAGDVLVWEAIQFEDGPNEHIGFSIGNGRAISNSFQERVPVEHDTTFGGTRRIVSILRS